MSAPKWWGDWRSTLTPHTGNLLATDLIECTMIVAGNPVNTVITGAQILGAVPTPSVAWGSITGTLSSQTDLNTALSGKASTGAVTGTGITMSTACILGRSTAGTGAIEEITIGSGLTLTAGTLTASGGSSSLTVGTTAIASGTIGRILFQGTGNVLQQSANLFWDNTNGRLGINTALPNMALDIRTGNVGIGVTSDAGFKLDVNGTARVQGMTTISGTFINIPAISTTGFYIQPYSANNIVLGFNTYFNNSFKAISNGYIYYINQDAANFKLLGSNASVSAGLTGTMLTHFDFNNTESKLFNGKLNSNSSTYFDFLIGNGANLDTKFIKISYGAGSGYSHYFVSRHDASINSIQNQISLYLNNSTTSTGSSAPNTGNVLNNTQSVISSAFFQPTLFKIGGSVTDTATSSAAVEIASTTKGFLPPRMTTAQKNAIATPVAGLVVYDTTLNKLCVRTASAWETITSL